MGPHPQSDAQWYYESVSYDRKKARMLSDPDYYARIREQGRRSQRKRVDKNRKRPFVERPSGRIPDYMTKREVAESARHSAFNWVNQSNDQARANAAFANQLYRERWGIDD